MKRRGSTPVDVPGWEGSCGTSTPWLHHCGPAYAHRHMSARTCTSSIGTTVRGRGMREGMREGRGEGGGRQWALRQGRCDRRPRQRSCVRPLLNYAAIIIRRRHAPPPADTDRVSE
eukprot:GHVU01173497.1.p1 GENE.GHVU01173497.1~~GHVU01173497.1.p1  ORF type:complete len:116 (-),score=5.09 GHVU01173497.1:114-461(-)